VSSANLLDEEHDFLVWYGETDAAEPVGYMPWFRNNSFKGQLRIFGKNGGRPQGASKLELALCPGGSPGYFDTCPDACKDSSIYTFAYMGGGAPVAIPWDASTSYRIVVQWKPGVIAWSRGVESEMTATFPGTYAPKALRVRLGSPRHVAGSVNTMPLGIVFKDLKVVGEPGTPTPVCGSVAPDAGPEDIGAVDTALPELDAATFEDTGAPSPTDTGDPRILPPPKGTDDLLPKDEGDLTGSCACRAVPSPHSTSPWISIAIAALAIVIVQRRRR